MNTEHTPGPLQAVRHFTEQKPDGSLIVDEHGNYVAALYCSPFTNFRSAQEQHANATLFAAAPRLLSALQKSAAVLDSFLNGSGDPTGEATNAALTEARSALADVLK